jgi:hypothetical protein
MCQVYSQICDNDHEYVIKLLIGPLSFRQIVRCRFGSGGSATGPLTNKAYMSTMSMSLISLSILCNETSSTCLLHISRPHYLDTV